MPSDGSAQSSKGEVGESLWWRNAVRWPSRLAPSTTCCCCSSRWPQELNICSRLKASLTGRPTWRAASVTWGQIIALQPKPPPMKCVMTRTFDGDRQLRGGDALRRVVKGQPVAVPDCGGGRRLDRVVVVGGK